MKRAPYTFGNLNLAVAMLLMLFAFKIAAPLVTVKFDMKALSYVLTLDNDGADEKTDTEKNADKNIELFTLNQPCLSVAEYELTHVCLTTYMVHYIPVYFHQVIIPPPDGYLTPLA